jgi:hypothetical protein
LFDDGHPSDGVLSLGLFSGFWVFGVLGFLGFWGGVRYVILPLKKDKNHRGLQPRACETA